MLISYDQVKATCQSVVRLTIKENEQAKRSQPCGGSREGSGGHNPAAAALYYNPSSPRHPQRQGASRDDEYRNEDHLCICVSCHPCWRDRIGRLGQNSEGEEAGHFRPWNEIQISCGSCLVTPSCRRRTRACSQRQAAVSLSLYSGVSGGCL